MAVRSRRRRGIDYWPGFVDALSSLLMVLVFIILIFVIGQYVLSDAVSGRDRAISRLNAELAALANTLSLEKTERARADTRIGELTATLTSEQHEKNALSTTLTHTQESLSATESEAARLSADINALQRLKQELESEVARLSSSLDTSSKGLKEQTEVSERALAQVELLNRQLAEVRTQLEALNKALSIAESGVDERDRKIEDLGRELNLALATKVRELSRYRSEFFGRLSKVLGEREDIHIVGDRFVFASEVLFPSASDEVSEDGMTQLVRLAETLKTLSREIPADIPWVLQVDGHTDRRPISNARFPSNWELSTARALAIVKFLRDQGISPERLAATGYGEYHPIDAKSTAEALARNRRIEFKLTSR